MKQKLREQGQCTQCGQPATHSHECASCHVATLSIVTIKGKYPPYRLAAITEGFQKADLFHAARDKAEDSGVRHIASTVVNLALANRLYVNDVQREIVLRLRESCKVIEEETDASRADYARRLTDWLGTILNHMKKVKA